MESSIQTWVWLAAGLGLLATEIKAPHLVAGFLGTSALVVAGLRALGLVESLPASVGLWGVTSLALLLSLRKTLAKYAAKPEVSKASVSDDVRLFGSLVDVVTAIPEGGEGRIRLDGTSWQAVCLIGPVPAGSRARLVRRENLVWVVEPASAPEAKPALPAKTKEE
jgi:membrane protein implicated in regulation of membrane protease activity